MARLIDPKIYYFSVTGITKKKKKKYIKEPVTENVNILSHLVFDISLNDKNL